MQIIISGKRASGKTLLARAILNTIKQYLVSESNHAKTERVDIISTNTMPLIQPDWNLEGVACGNTNPCKSREVDVLDGIRCIDTVYAPFVEPTAQPAPNDLRQYLGRKATDKITGFTGTVTGSATYVTGCDQVSIVGKSVDNKPADCLWLDINRVDFTDAEPIKLDTSVDKGACESPSKY